MMRNYQYGQQSPLQGLMPIPQALQSVLFQKLLDEHRANSVPGVTPMAPTGLRASTPLTPDVNPGMAAGLAQTADSLSPALAGRGNILQAILGKFGVLKRNPSTMGQ